MTDQEINEAVARKLGTEKQPGVPCWCKQGYCEHRENYKDYCHSIEAAWKIVEHLTKPNTGFVFGLDWRGDEGWWCKMEFGHIDALIRVYETGDTAPMAIVLAFLELNSPPIP